MFHIEKSFTQLDWLIMEKALGGGDDLDLREIEDFQKLQLAANILPDGQGILHKLANATNLSKKD